MSIHPRYKRSFAQGGENTESSYAFYRQRWLPGSGPNTWTHIPVSGFALILNTSTSREPSASTFFVALGEEEPTSTDDPRVTRMHAGDVIHFDEGFSEIWVRSINTDNGWTLTIVRQPGIYYYQPGPANPYAQVTDSTLQTTLNAAPTLATQGVAIEESSRQVVVHAVKYVAPNESRVDAAVEVEVWWFLQSDVGGETGLWSHNTDDDFSASAADTDAKAYTPPLGATRVAVVTDNANYTGRVYFAA